MKYDVSDEVKYQISSSYNGPNLKYRPQLPIERLVLHVTKLLMHDYFHFGVKFFIMTMKTAQCSMLNAQYVLS